jgi:hypothetical protein
MAEKYGKFFEIEGVFADDLKFLAPAICTEELRYFMNCLMIEETYPDKDGNKQLRAIATDGTRMHVVDPLPPSAVQIHDIKPGRYRVLKVNRYNVQMVEYPGAPDNFPDWKKVVPTTEPTWERDFYGAEKCSRKTFSIEYAKLSYISGKVCAIDHEFLRPLVGFSWKVGIYDNEETPFISKVLVFKSGTKTAYIMPLCAD